MNRLLDELKQVEAELSAWKKKELYAENPAEEGRCRIAINRLTRKEEEILAQLEKQEVAASVPEASAQLILFVCASPSEKNPLDFGTEFKRIKAARYGGEKRDNFRVDIETGVAANQVMPLLARHQPAIIHLSMHASKSKGLYFEHANGLERPVTDQELGETFALLSKKYVPHLVVLSACNTYRYAQAIAPYVRHVVGTRDFFPDQMAFLYAQHLYQMLFDGHDVAYAHEAAQLALKQAGIPEEEQARLSMPIHEIPVLVPGP